MDKKNQCFFVLDTLIFKKKITVKDNNKNQLQTLQHFDHGNPLVSHGREEGKNAFHL